jgi:hypothetical protein
MNWHYAINGENRGPVADDEFHRLVQQGVVTRETLIWTDGMANWTPYREKFPGLPSLSAAGPQDGVACGMCGRRVPKDETLALNGISYCAVCKPQVLQRMREGVSLGGTGVEETRNQHIKHEASLKSVGILYYLGGAALFFAGLATIPAALSSNAKPEALVASMIFVLLGVLQVWTGAALRKFRSWARVVAGVLSGIGLLGFPIGTIINAYILYLLFSQKGKTVFSPEYQQVIQQTPHIKYKTSIIVWIFLGIIVLVLLLAVGSAIFSSKR